MHSFQFFIRIISKVPHTDWGLQAGFSSPSAQPGTHFKPFIPFSLHPVQAIHSFQCFIWIIVKILYTDWGFRAGFPRRQPTRLPISSHSFLSVFIRFTPFIPFSLSSGSLSRFHTLILVSKQVSLAVSTLGCPFEAICVYQSFTRIAHAPTPAHSLHLLCASTCAAIHSFQSFTRFKPSIPVSLHPAHGGF